MHTYVYKYITFTSMWKNVHVYIYVYICMYRGGCLVKEHAASRVASIHVARTVPEVRLQRLGQEPFGDDGLGFRVQEIRLTNK